MSEAGSSPENKPDVKAEAVREDLSLRSIFSAYVRGSRVNPKPRMVDKMLAGGVQFNWFAWLLGPYYFLYRKQWKAGWIYLVVLDILYYSAVFISTLLLTLNPVSAESTVGISVLGSLWEVIRFIGGIAVAFTFYPLYRRAAAKAFLDWKNAENSSCSASRFIERAGGISWIGVIAAIAIDLTIAIILALAFPDLPL